jgi:hypothetical protein
MLLDPRPSKVRQALAGEKCVNTVLHISLLKGAWVSYGRPGAWNIALLASAERVS